MKIIVILESIDIDDSSASKANLALINNLKNCGFEIIVYHYTRYDVKMPNGVECHSINEIKFGINYILSRIQRIIQKNSSIRLNVFFERIFGFSFSFFNDVKSIKKVLKQIKNTNSDFILTLGKGMSFRPHYAMLSFPEIHHKWIANIHDPYPFHYNPRPYNWVEPGYDIKEKFFRKVSEKAAFSCFPSKLLLEWMGSYFPNFLKTGVVVPHQNVESIISDSVLPDYFDTNKFTLLHAGNLMKQRSPEGLLKGFKLFLENNPNAADDSRLILLGHAQYHIKLLEKYTKTIRQFYYSGYVEFNVIYKLQKNVSVNIILESKSEISPFLPGKLPHCVEADKPLLLLSPYYSETRRLMGENYSYWSEVDQVEKIAAIIEKLYQLWKNDKSNLTLNRKDLYDYCSPAYLEKVIKNLKVTKY